MEIFDVFSMNGIENNPASGEIFLENVFLRSHRHIFQRFLSQGGHKFIFQGGGAMPPLGGGVKYPDCT